MLNRTIAPFRRLGTGFADNDFANNYGAADLALVNGLWQNIKVPDKSPSAFQAAVASGTPLSIYTVTAGKVPVVYSFEVMCSVRTGVALRYNAANIFNFILQANTHIAVSIHKGLQLATTGAAFDIVQSSGGVADLSAHLVLAEY